MKKIAGSWRVGAGVVLVGMVAMQLFGSVRPAQAGIFSVSAKQEAEMGDEAAREIEGSARLIHGPVEEWVNRVGKKLAAVSNPEWKYRFHVIDNPEINAFCLPGGHVYVYTGLRKIVKTDDELAAVLAHEITHAEEHHFAKQYAKDSKRGILFTVLTAVAGVPAAGQQIVGLVDAAMGQKYSRSSEFEADALGFKRMVRAGYNPQGMLTLLQRLDEEDGKPDQVDKWFGSHPDGKQRVEAVRRLLPANSSSAKTFASPPGTTVSQ